MKYKRGKNVYNSKKRKTNSEKYHKARYKWNNYLKSIQNYGIIKLMFA